MIFDRFCDRLKLGELGPGAERVEELRVTLRESHVAWAARDGAVPR